ncbi:NUDIX hydrolase [Thalassococcus sp. S3]|uniref:NUDIX hydrolase n=1 Tax=Thalassococcus sp. S3 TaxID=2017482 RepID=UPI0010248FD9|nr:NUDIX hydrolase [Thalassococcus sp. S3]QBF34122.1 NUDIX hydrolase [Thalassococcus sp. S3]
MIRRFGSAPEKGQKYILRPGVYAILPKGGALLLTCQNDGTPDIQLPGGGIDPGESPLVALQREVYEETGWLIGRPRRIGAFRRYAFMPEYDLWAEKLCTIYTALPTRRLGPPLEEHHEVMWMTPDRASKMLGNAGDRHFVKTFVR